MRCHATPLVNSCQHASATASASAASSSKARISTLRSAGRTARGRVALDARRRAECGFGNRDDRVGRAVVVGERDRSAPWEVASEVDEGRGVGARERVDRLRAVADDAEVGPVSEPGAEEPELERRGVLELVDEEVPKAPPLRGRELGVLFDRVGAPTQEIVEVEPPPLPLLRFVARVQVGERRPGARQPRSAARAVAA